MGYAEVDMDRVRAYLRSGPDHVPAPADLIKPGLLPARTVWPLVARRNLRRLLRIFAMAQGTSERSRETHRRIVAVLMGLPDALLDRVLTEPEVTSWLTGFGDDIRWDGVANLPALSRSVVAIAAAAGIDCEPLDIACDSGVVTLRPFAMDLVGDHTRCESGDAVAWCTGGEVHVRRGDHVWTLRRGAEGWDADGPVERLATTAGSAVVKGHPEAWLRASFPTGTHVSAETGVARRIAAGIDEGLGFLDDAWPEMVVEIRSLLRWVVPMADGDSFFVPAFRGMVAVPQARPLALGFHVVHELSHNIMSCLYDLVDVIRNPDQRVRSPFSRELEPLSSVIHSCWAFSHELRAIRRLRAAGHLDAGTDWERLITKIRIFYDRALPLVRAKGELTSYGVALLDAVEAQVYQEAS